MRHIIVLPGIPLPAGLPVHLPTYQPVVGLAALRSPFQCFSTSQAATAWVLGTVLSLLVARKQPVADCPVDHLSTRARVHYVVLNAVSRLLGPGSMQPRGFARTATPLPAAASASATE